MICEKTHDIFIKTHPDVKQIILRSPRSRDGLLLNVLMIFQDGFEYDFTFSLFATFIYDYTDILKRIHKLAWGYHWLHPDIKLLEKKSDI